MSENIILAPDAPRITKVPSGVDRPMWSVMVPTYNCARFLGQTLESVLAQAPSDDRMEIIVVDDMSTKDDPSAVVDQVGRGRVRFYRNSPNLGAPRNFNRCIELSSGHLVHILHGDDFVVDGFYRAVEEASNSHPDCALFSTGTIVVDEEGVPEGMSARLKHFAHPSRDARPIIAENRFATPSVVIRRSFYEDFGGFQPELVHAADWEMWSRATALGGAMQIPEPYARYRSFGSNDSSRLMRTGENIRDVVRIKSHLATLEGYDQRWHDSRLASVAYSQVEHYRKMGDREAYRSNLEAFRTVGTWGDRTKTRLRSMARQFARMILG